DFSEITGKLSCMRTAASRTEANVALAWKRYKDQQSINWRVEVVASKKILSFQELVRPISDSLTSHFWKPPKLEPGHFPYLATASSYIF
ncbi:hypothetical protein BJ875DRAFT_386319, partial [Amylocarpus encephaloides]